jgi:hypothetical protein
LLYENCITERGVQDKLSTLRSPVRFHQSLKDSIVNSIERLTQLDEHSTELQSVLEAKEFHMTRLERSVSRPHKLEAGQT